MSTRIEDSDGDRITVVGESDGITLDLLQKDEGESSYATVGPVDPHELIAAIHAEMGWDRPISEFVTDQINSGKLKVDGPADAAIENIEEEVDAREDMPHTRPATAEEPRLWAGADEPIIDQLIGRVADLEDEKQREEAHQHLSDHWERRLAVAEQALTMVPAPAKRGGVLSAFAGEEVDQPDRIEKALKIARFAADEDRDIPGVDR